MGYTMLVPVIISGGAGSRLWPVSREMHPKPFIRLADGQSLIQKAFLRATSLAGVKQVLTVTNQNLVFTTQDAYNEVKPLIGSEIQPQYLLEPVGRNTAPAIAASAAYIAEKFGADAIILVLSADHLIQDQAAFQAAVDQACTLALEGQIVTFGIQPHAPETGYGYIEADAHTVLRFVEKPDLATATAYVDSGRFLWNAGIFCFTAQTMLDQLTTLAPALKSTIEQCIKQLDVHSIVSTLPLETFGSAEDISIDYAIMEKAACMSVVACDIGWSDVGSWASISELAPTNSQGNQIEAEVVSHNTQGCYIHSDETNRVIATVGLRNLVIVDTPDALLIADRSHTQDVKHIVGQLKRNNDERYKLHRTVSRPWGTYTTLEEREGFKIKRIVVKPGGSLSLQMHHHRSEHWIVVSGIAKVVNGDRELLIRPNESTYIPAGQNHRLTNPGMIDCVMIEVQVGSYLGEDDIVRFTDIYGRC